MVPWYLVTLTFTTYGARPEQLNPKIRTNLEGKIIPSTQMDLPIAPNFFLAIKGPDGTPSVASRQACYDGALGARGLLSLQSYSSLERQYDNRAYTLTSIYHDGQLKMYTTHPIPPSIVGTGPQYVMTLVKAWALTSDHDTFRDGVAAYRNGRDWAKQQRDTAIKEANKRASRPDVATSQRDYGPQLVSARDTINYVSRVEANQPNSDASISHGSDTSADELSQDLPALKRARSPRKIPYPAGPSVIHSYPHQASALRSSNPSKESGQLDVFSADSA